MRGPRGPLSVRHVLFTEVDALGEPGGSEDPLGAGVVLRGLFSWLVVPRRALPAHSPPGRDRIASACGVAAGHGTRASVRLKLGRR